MIEDTENFTGKFVIVNYDSKPFVGQVVQVVGNELEVKEGCKEECICVARTSRQSLLLQIRHKGYYV